MGSGVEVCGGPAWAFVAWSSVVAWGVVRVAFLWAVDFDGEVEA